MSRRDLLFGLFKSQPPSPEDTTTVSWQEQRREARTPTLTRALVAKVLTFSCLNQLGGFCGTCVERCPVEGAIAMNGRVPRIDPASCTGCGDCQELCPAPGNAILMAPRT